jgi:hypothetical protein
MNKVVKKKNTSDNWFELRSNSTSENSFSRPAIRNKTVMTQYDDDDSR